MIDAFTNCSEELVLESHKPERNIRADLVAEIHGKQIYITSDQNKRIAEEALFKAFTMYTLTHSDLPVSRLVGDLLKLESESLMRAKEYIRKVRSELTEPDEVYLKEIEGNLISGLCFIPLE